MKKPVNLLRDFSKKSIPDLLTLARTVAAGSIYTDKKLFQEPPVTQDDLQDQVDTLRDAYDAARNRDSIAVARQDLADRILLESLGMLARYAGPLVYNNEAAIEATGFEASANETRPAGELPPPVFSLEPLSGGAVRVNLGQKGRADAFTVIAIAAAGSASVSLDAGMLVTEGTAYIRTDTHAKMTLQGLPRSTRLKIYAFAANSAGAGPLSQGMEVTTQ